MNFFDSCRDLEPLLKELEQRSGVKSSVGKYKIYWKVPYFSFIQHRIDDIDRGYFVRNSVQFQIHCLKLGERK